MDTINIRLSGEEIRPTWVHKVGDHWWELSQVGALTLANQISRLYSYLENRRQSGTFRLWIFAYAKHLNLVEMTQARRVDSWFPQAH